MAASDINMQAAKQVDIRTRPTETQWNVTILQSIARVWEKSPSEEPIEQEAEMNFNWVAMLGAWRRISAGSRRWFDEAIRLRGQAEAVYFGDD